MVKNNLIKKIFTPIIFSAGILGLLGSCNKETKVEETPLEKYNEENQYIHQEFDFLLKYHLIQDRFDKESNYSTLPKFDENEYLVQDFPDLQLHLGINKEHFWDVGKNGLNAIKDPQDGYTPSGKPSIGFGELPPEKQLEVNKRYTEAKKKIIDYVIQDINKK